MKIDFGQVEFRPTGPTGQVEKNLSVEPCNGTGSLVFIDDVIADKSSRMNSEVFRAILSSHIQPNVSELIGASPGMKHSIG